MQLSDKALAIAPSLTLKISAMSKEMKQKGLDVIGFGAGEPDFDTPQYIKAAAIDAIGKGMTKYTPASGTTELKQAICDRYQRKFGLVYQPNQVVVSNGAKQSLFNIFQAILNPGDEVIVISPYWLTYPELIKMASGVPVYVQAFESNDFKASYKDIERAVTKKTRAILLNSPSNPCGCVYTKEELEQIAGVAARHDLYIISDEIYDELIYDGLEHVCTAQVSDDAMMRTIIVNGMSKTYAMTGWRIGYTISSPELSKVMGSYQSHSTSNPCSISQYASVAALNGPQDEIEKMRAIFDERRKKICTMINAIDGLSCKVPHGAFYVMMNIEKTIGKTYEGKEITGSLSFCELLLEAQKTAVVPGIAFGSDGCVRLSYATSDSNIEKGVLRIGEFVKSLK